MNNMSTIDQYKVVKIIGSGAYGKVYKATHIPTNTTVALKSIKLQDEPQLLHLQLVMLAREMQILFKLSRQENNQFTVNLLDAFVNKEATTDSKQLNKIYLVMEYFDFDLLKLLSNKANQINKLQAKTLVYNLLLAVKYLHSTGVMHRDLKPSNILITEKCTIKLCDFGFARNYKVTGKAEGKQRSLSPVCFTRWYRPPEICFKKQKYDQRCDMWSFGCIASEIMQQSNPKRANDDSKVLFRGSSSYAISPCATDKSKSSNNVSQNDQMFKILEVLGDQELPDSFFESTKMHKFYKFAQDWAKNQEPKPIEKIHDDDDQDILKMLKQCLALNPEGRCTAEECLKNKAFDEIRGQYEHLIVGDQINVKIDQLKVDESGETCDYSVSKMQRYLVNYIQKIRDHCPLTEKSN